MPEFNEAQQMASVATYCKAARLIQLAESRCAALGVHPRGALAERALVLALLDRAAPVERDAVVT